jgi:hypothetical protein
VAQVARAGPLVAQAAQMLGVVSRAESLMVGPAQMVGAVSPAGLTLHPARLARAEW